REAIKDRYKQVFENLTGSTLDLQVDDITFPNNKQALEKGVAVIKNTDGTEDKSAFRVLFNKIDGKWYLSQVSEIDLQEPISNFENLKDLSWLVGTWVDEDEDSKIEQTFEWDKNKNFLRQRFAVTVNNQTDLEGEQIIGWDPAKEKIRSWIFDSDGGF